MIDGYVAGAGLDVIEEEDGLFYEVRAGGTMLQRLRGRNQKTVSRGFRLCPRDGL